MIKRYIEMHSLDWFISSAQGVIGLVEQKTPIDSSYARPQEIRHKGWIACMLSSGLNSL
jgi:hypothetical protein